MRATILWLAVSGLFLAGNTAYADVPSYQLVKEKSSLKFVAIENGAPIEGNFKDFTADIHFDPNQLDQSSISVDVPVGSVSVANDDVNQNIRLPEWLSVDKFPHALFKSKKISRMPKSDNYYAEGELTLRGVTMPVMLNFQMEHFDAHEAIATGYVTLHRSEFGVGQGQWAKDDTIKNEVRVEFRIVATK